MNPKNFKNSEEFEDVFVDILRNLSKYLQDVESEFDYSKVESQKLFDYLALPERSLAPTDINTFRTFTGSFKSNQRDINVITLNYTRSLEKILNFNDKPISIGKQGNIPFKMHSLYHLHGYVDKRMILGVNDISQLSNTAFHSNSDVLNAIIKSKCNEASKETITNTCEKQILGSQIICIFGSSLGKTDNMWWKLIGEHLKRNMLLIVFEKTSKIEPLLSYRQDREVQRIKKNILSKLKLTDKEKSEISKRIIVSVNSNMFDLLSKN